MGFLELFGMPASGKTYLIKKLKKNSSFSNNINVFFYFEKRSIRSFLIKFFFIIISSYLIFNASYLNKIIIFFKDIYKPKKSEKISLRTFSILFNTIFLISIMRIYLYSKQDRNVFIDQGFFQILFSIIYEMDLKNNKQIESLIKNWLEITALLNKKIYLIYCESEYKNIMLRISTRNGDSILERENNNLKIYQEIFDQILNFLINKKEEFPYIILKKISTTDENSDLLKIQK